MEARRTPTQSRSRQRVERILEAATHVFAEAGYEGATTEAIAARAGTSIGSIYQFFPNKKALFDAIADRYLDQIRTLFDAVMTKEALAQPWQELLDVAIDVFSAFHKTSPGFQAVMKSVLISPDFLVKGEALNREIASRLEKVLAVHAPAFTRKERELVATVLVETVSALLIVGAQRGEPFATRLMQEAKVLVRRYLEPYAVTKVRKKKK